MFTNNPSPPNPEPSAPPLPPPNPTPQGLPIRSEKPLSPKVLVEKPPIMRTPPSPPDETTDESVYYTKSELDEKKGEFEESINRMTLALDIQDHVMSKLQPHLRTTHKAMDTMQRIEERIKKLEKKTEFPADKFNNVFAEFAEQLDKVADRLDKLDRTRKDTKKNTMEQKVKFMTEESSENSETDTEYKLYRKQKYKKKSDKVEGLEDVFQYDNPKYSDDWHDYLDKFKPLQLPNPDWVASWESEGRPLLKIKFYTMGTLQSREASALKSLKESCKEYNERLRTITNTPGEFISLQNIARLCRNFMIRFKVSPNIFTSVFSEFCLPAQLKALIINSAVISQGETALLNWLSERNLNQGSETRLKYLIRNYIKTCLASKRPNVVECISNVQGILLPELLSCSNSLGWTSASPLARANQSERECRNYLLDSIEKNHPTLHNYLGLTGDISANLSILSQKIESFLNFTGNSPKMVGTDGGEKSQFCIQTVFC